MRPLLLAIALTAAACAQATPELAVDHARRGDKALAEGRYTEALTAYTHAREMAPQDSAIQRGLMRARAYVMADSPARVGDGALDDLRYEAQYLLDTDKARAAVYLIALANIALRRGDLAEARARVDEALRAEPGSAIARTARGLMLAGQKESRAQAKAEFEAALKFRPESFAALVGLGQLELEDGDLPGAIDKLEAALRLNDDYGARMALGNARLQQDKAADAAEQFQRAVQIDPKSADALSSLGQALLNAGRPEDAERVLRAAVQIRHDEATVIALGYAVARQKKAAQALEIFTRVLADDGGAALALYGAGMAAQDLGHSDQAIGYYRRLVALPADPKRAMLAGMQKDAEGRLKALEAATAASATPSASPAAGAPKR